jgi:hydrogenase-4 membrane subunit HyfE
MFRLFYGIDSSMMILLFILWWIVAYQGSNLAFRPTKEKIYYSTRLNLRFVYIGMGVLIVRLLWLIPLWLNYGWMFVHEKVMITAPLLIVPAIFVILYSIPKLKRIVNELSADSAEEKAAFNRGRAADPALVIPLQAVALGTTAGLYILLFPQTPPYINIGLSLAGMMAVVVSVLWFRQQKRARNLNGYKVHETPPLSFRMMKKAAVFIGIGIVVSTFIVYDMEQSKHAEQMSMMDHHLVDYGGGPVLSHGEHSHHHHETDE